MKKNKPEPVLIKGQTLDQMFSEISNAPAQKIPTRKEKKELNELLKQLIDSQGPGDAFVMMGIPEKKN